MIIKHIGIKLLSFLLLVCSFNAAAVEISVYTNSRADIVILHNHGSASHIYGYGGAPDLGPSTPADCAVSASLYFDDDSELFSGDVQGINTNSISYSSADAKGHKASLEIEDEFLEIKELDVFGLCAFGIDFTGQYIKANPGTPSFNESLIAILQLVYEDSLHRLNDHDIRSAIRNLEPFIGAIDVSNTTNGNYSSVAIILNDYGYMLQKVSRDREAIEIFGEVIRIDPSRTVVYLNLADSYWAIKCGRSAGTMYQKYEQMMEAQGQYKNIPSRVSERQADLALTPKAR